MACYYIMEVIAGLEKGTVSVFMFEFRSRMADDICMSLLLPQRLENQFCFRTEQALSCLTWKESEYIWL